LNTSNSNLKFLINENFNINNSYLNTSNSNLKFLINDNFNINNSYLNTSNSNLKYSINENSNLLLSKINDNIQNGSLFSNLNTDTISIGTSNRFIVNDIYDRNVLFAGTLTTSNLNVLGSFNVLETNVYESDKIELINYGTSTTLIVNQTSNYKNVAEFYNNTNPTFIITSNSNIGIGIINPNTNYKLDVKGKINCSDLYINNITINDVINDVVYDNIIYTSNILNSNIINAKNYNNYSFNSTIIDFKSITTSNVYIVNSDYYSDTHLCYYTKYIHDSELLIQVDFPYKINGFGSDVYASRLLIESEVENEYSIEHQQIFIGYASGGGTRSTTLSPITHASSIKGSNIKITVQIKLIDSDDSIITDKCIFIITEKKPSSTLNLVKYDTDNLPIGNSNRFITNDSYNSPTITFSGTVTAPNLNIIGTTSSFINTSINCSNNIQINNNSDSSALLISQMNINQSLVEFYRAQNLEFIIDSNGNVGINQISPNYKLDVNGEINCTNISINDTPVMYTVNSNLLNTSNSLYDFSYINFSNAKHFNTFAYNSTVVDFTSHITSNSYTVNSSNYTDTHYFTYYKNISDSELLIHADFPYKIDGYGTDSYASRIKIISELESTNPEYSIEHEQIFVGYASGGGTRSTTLSPICHKTAIIGNIVTIVVQIKLIDSDDSLTTDKCIFVITEKKPTSKLVLTKYITTDEVITLTSNLYITPVELSDVLVNYQTNDYGQWISNVNNGAINYGGGNVGIGISIPNYTLDVNGIINANSLYLNNIDILSTIDSRIEYQSNILDEKIIFSENRLNNKIDTLNSDYITNGNYNRFIVNDIYNRNVTFTKNLFASNITTSNLNVIGDNTTFNTTVYQTEQLQIVNDTSATSFILKQLSLNQNVCEFYNGENLNFVLNSNGNIGIGVDLPNYKCDIYGSLNCSSIFVNNCNLIDSFNENVYLTSNELIEFTTATFNRLQNSNLVGFNSTLIDFKSIVTSNIYIINSSNYTNTHTCSYRKFFPDSELLIQADFPYKINGFGSDHYSSRLKITSDKSNDIEYSLEHEQVFIGYASGGGTRSTTLSPLNYKTEIEGDEIFITVQLRLIDSDDSIITDKCIFIITEKKPSNRLVLSSYLNESDIPRLTSNLYINPNQFETRLLSYESNIYGRWVSNVDNRNIYYEALDSKVGIGISTPNYKLDVNGSLNCDQLYRNGISLDTTLYDYVTLDALMAKEYVNSNKFRDVVNSNIVGYNTTLVDFNSIVTSNTFIVNSSNYVNTHTCSYQKFFPDSELLIQADFPYKINGFGSDHYASRLIITSEVSNDPEYSLEHEQIFIGYASGGGTRSTTLSPINHKTNMTGSNINITVQIKLIDSDDSLITDKCIFIITEKKPSSMLYFTNYINERDIPRLTSNLYVSQTDFAITLQSYQTNNYGKWNCNSYGINYNDGNVGINKNNPQEKLDINGNIIVTGEIISSFSDIRLKTITTPITNALEIISKINGFKYKPNDIAKSFGYSDEKEMVGVNAQEIFNLIPEIVSLAPFDINTDNSGNKTSKSGNNYLTVQYDKLVPFLIESIKELKKENEKLINRIKRIENYIFK
jgi:hypothetical protein